MSDRTNTNLCATWMWAFACIGSLSSLQLTTACHPSCYIARKRYPQVRIARVKFSQVVSKQRCVINHSRIFNNFNMAVKIPPTDALLFLVSDKNNSILTTKSTGQRFYYPAGYTELPTFALKNFNYTNDNGT